MQRGKTDTETLRLNHQRIKFEGERLPLLLRWHVFQRFGNKRATSRFNKDNPVSFKLLGTPSRPY